MTTTRIAALTAIFLVACTSAGPGTEPPSGGASAFMPAAGSGAGTGGVGGSAGAAGVGGMMSSGGVGGEDNGGEGGSAGAISAGAGGSGGQGGAQDMPDAGLDAGPDGGDDRDIDTGWSDGCGSVTLSGHCTGDVYEWCDYYERGLKQLDCGALGMTCHAGPQPTEDESNGCAGDPCTAQDEHCDGNLRYDCRGGALVVTDCQRIHGPASACELYHDDFANSDYIRCTRDQPCDTPNVLWCDEELEVICDEEGKQYVIDCQASDPNGRCVVSSGDPQCDPPFPL